MRPDAVGHDRTPRRSLDGEGSVDRADQEIVGPDLDRLARLDDAARRAAAIAAGQSREQRRPAAEVVQPASMAAIRTRWSAAAPSMTAWSIEIGSSDRMPRRVGLRAYAGSISVISGVYFSIAARIALCRQADILVFEVMLTGSISSWAPICRRLLSNVMSRKAWTPDCRRTHRVAQGGRRSWLAAIGWTPIRGPAARRRQTALNSRSDRSAANTTSWKTSCRSMLYQSMNGRARTLFLGLVDRYRGQGDRRGGVVVGVDDQPGAGIWSSSDAGRQRRGVMQKRSSLRRSGAMRAVVRWIRVSSPRRGR